MFKYARKYVRLYNVWGFKQPSLCECAHIFNNDNNNNNETKQLHQSHAFSCDDDGYHFLPSPQSGSFAGVYVNCVSRVYFKCFVNFIMTQTIECKMYDNKTDTSLGHGSSRPK